MLKHLAEGFHTVFTAYLLSVFILQANFLSIDPSTMGFWDTARTRSRCLSHGCFPQVDLQNNFTSTVSFPRNTIGQPA